MSRISYIIQLILHIGTLFPVRILRIYSHLAIGLKGGIIWISEPFKAVFRIQNAHQQYKSIAWSIIGLKSTLTWLYSLLLKLFELIGIGEILMIIWAFLFTMRPLTSLEIEASLKVHPMGLIPYHLIRVDNYSWLSRISRSAICSMYVIHLEEDSISLATMIHELTHVAQYVAVGAIYMPQAVMAQNRYGRYGGHGSKSAYDYEREAPLDIQILNGQKYSDLNREAQAELVQDYFILMQKKQTIPRNLFHFIEQMRKKEF